MLKSRHFYYIKVGTTKYVPKVGTKSRHIYYLEVGYIEICTLWGIKVGVQLLKSMDY